MTADTLYMWALNLVDPMSQERRYVPAFYPCPVSTRSTEHVDKRNAQISVCHCRRSGKYFSRADRLRTCTAKSPASSIAHPSIPPSRLWLCGRASGGPEVRSCACTRGLVREGVEDTRRGCATHRFSDDSHDGFYRASVFRSLLNLGVQARQY